MKEEREEGEGEREREREGTEGGEKSGRKERQEGGRKKGVREERGKERRIKATKFSLLPNLWNHNQIGLFPQSPILSIPIWSILTWST